MFKLNSERVREELFRRGLSTVEFAAQAGISAVTAAKLLKDGASATPRVIAKLARFFDVQGNSLIISGK